MNNPQQTATVNGSNSSSATAQTNGFSLAGSETRIAKPLREKQALAMLIGGVQDDKNEVLEKLRTHHFSDRRTLQLFNWTTDLFFNGKVITEQAVVSAIQLRARPAEYEQMMELLAEVMMTPLSDTFENCFEDLQNAYVYRLVYQEIIMKTNSLFHQNVTPGELIDHVTNAMLSLDTGEEGVDYKSGWKLVLDQILNPKPENGGMMTGLKDFDVLFGGVKEDRMYVVGGYNGSGKTAMVIDLICRLCTYHQYWRLAAGKRNEDKTDWDYERGEKIAVKFFSLEMSVERVIFRIVSWLTGITEKQLSDQGQKNGQGEWLVEQLTDEQRNQVLDAYHRAAGWPIDISYTTANAKRLKQLGKKFALKNKGKRLIYILDHVGMVDKNGKDNRIAFDEIMDVMKSFQRDHKASCFPLLQLSRETEKGKDADKRFWRPNKTHLMESVGVEAIADAIILLWRPGKKWDEIPYDGNTRWSCKNKLIEIIEKNRDGQSYIDIVFDCQIQFNRIFDALDF